MYLSEIKVVDLEHSSWDKDKSKPDLGQYEFLQKEYINYSTKTRRPRWFFTWVHNSPRDNYKDVLDHKIKWQYTYVTVDDPYWPEGLAPVNGQYVYGDVVLMKCPLVVELRRREIAKQMSDGQAMSTLRQYNDTAKQYGVSLSDRDQDAIDRMAQDLVPK